MNVHIDQEMGFTRDPSFLKDLKAKAYKKAKKKKKYKREIDLETSKYKKVKALKNKMKQAAAQHKKMLILVGGAGLAGIVLFAILKK